MAKKKLIKKPKGKTPKSAKKASPQKSLVKKSVKPAKKLVKKQVIKSKKVSLSAKKQVNKKKIQLKKPGKGKQIVLKKKVVKPVPLKKVKGSKPTLLKLKAIVKPLSKPVSKPQLKVKAETSSKIKKEITPAIPVKVPVKKESSKKSPKKTPIHRNLRPLKPVPVVKREEIKVPFPKILSDKKQFKIEYEIKSSTRMLFNYLSTPSGLAAWFADDAHFNEGIFTFFWNGSSARAKIIGFKDEELVAFQWIDEPDNSYFVFEIVLDDITTDVALIITDFAFPAEIEQNTLLWNSQIHELQQVIGS